MENGSDIDLLVAQRLRELRSLRGITLNALAEQTGLSAPYLSRLEKGERQPSIGTLLQLARVYGVSVGELVEERGGDGYYLLRSADATVHRGPDGLYTVLSGPHSTVSVLRVEIPPGRHSKDARHSGEEWLHVLSGSARLALDGEPITLNEGDAVQFDSGRTHSLANDGEDTATVLIVSTSATTPAHHPTPPSRRAATPVTATRRSAARDL
ncbi:XRE family transcriptional regulator [Streptosporangium sp. NPDC002544]|uniref:helix-turn-helix domain-containing protein n=1 Tax=Streptosporangium sp. NPDC002544 TaxID=3154538 RepID=UPI0033285D77